MDQFTNLFKSFCTYTFKAKAHTWSFLAQINIRKNLYLFSMSSTQSLIKIKDIGNTITPTFHNTYSILLRLRLAGMKNNAYPYKQQNYKKA
jgi:hypothetical protein